MMWELQEPVWRLWVGLAVGGAFVVAGLRVERRRAISSWWRKAAIWGVALALVALVAPPLWTRTVDPASALVLTPSTRPERRSHSGGNSSPGVLAVALPGVETRSPMATAPDLATFLRQHPQVDLLRIAGDGLQPWDLDRLAASVEWVAPPTPSLGLRAVTWNRSLELGQSLRVTGSLSDPLQVEAYLRLEGPGASNEGIEPGAEPRSRKVPFTLECTPPGVGRFEYRLILEDGAHRELVSEIIDVHVKAVEPMSILWLENAPSFESRFFKEWAGRLGSKLAIRSRVSRDRYHFEYHNLEEFDLNHLTSEVLEPFDLVVVDQRTWESLRPVEQTLVLESVRIEAVGLLVRLDSDRLASSEPGWPFDFSGERIADAESLLVRIEGLSNREIPTLEIGPFELTLERGNKPLLEDRAGRVLAMSRSWGAGSLGVTLVKQTFSWMLEGYPEVQKMYWRRMTMALARPLSQPVWHLPPGPILVDEPLELALDWPPSGEVELQAIYGPLEEEADLLALRQDPEISNRWNTRVWPARVGWYRVEVEGARAEFFVASRNTWKEWQRGRRYAATSLAALEPRSVSPATAIRRKEPVRRWPLFLAVLGGLGALWLDERRGHSVSI